MADIDNRVKHLFGPLSGEEDVILFAHDGSLRQGDDDLLARATDYVTSEDHQHSEMY